MIGFQSVLKLMVKCIVGALIATLVSASANAIDWQDSPEIAALFAKAEVQGTFVMYDVSANTYTGFNRSRAETRFIPASTFKLPNSLIGLATGAVNSVDEIFPWDGKPRWMKSWEKDMDLREAIKLSAVPVYQEVARRVGLQRMQQNVGQIGYGNYEIGTVIDDFWLDGSLRISAVEQTGFLSKLAQGTLPFPNEVQASVRDIARLEQGSDWTLYGKTGWSAREQPIGWWVGWVEKNGRYYAFALNIDMPEQADAAKRIEIGKASLLALGVLN